MTPPIAVYDHLLKETGIAHENVEALHLEDRTFYFKRSPTSGQFEQLPFAVATPEKSEDVDIWWLMRREEGEQASSHIVFHMDSFGLAGDDAPAEDAQPEDAQPEAKDPSEMSEAELEAATAPSDEATRENSPTSDPDKTDDLPPPDSDAPQGDDKPNEPRF